LPNILHKKFRNSASTSIVNNNTLDNAAFEILFKENFAGLCAYCQYKFGFDLDLAKETVHSGFIKLWENRARLSPDSSIKVYLYTIITNISYDVMRHDKVKRKHENHVLENSTFNGNRVDFDRAEFSELKNNVDKAIAELPDQMRKIFELSRYEGLKYCQIAAHLSISVKTVETQMSRALVKLRSKLSDYLPFYSIIFLFKYLL
jgi:RNA polymerase sigma-70 factor, ECF subfamily